MSSSTSTPKPSGTLQITEVLVSGLINRKPFGSRPNPYLVITLDNAHRHETPTLKNTQNPRWQGPFEFFGCSSTSKIKISVFHRGLIGRPSLISDFTGTVEDLSNDVVYDLMKKGTVVGRLELKLQSIFEDNITPPDSNMALALASGAAIATGVPMVRYDTVKSQASRFSEDAAREDSNPLVFSEELQDGFSGLALIAAPFVAPLSQAVASLQRLVDIIQGIAEVHPILMAAFVVLTAVYRVVRNQTQQDIVVQEIAVELRDMLAFAREASSLRQIKGGLDVIREMGLAIQDGCRLLQEYYSQSFIRRAAKSAISNEMANRIRACKYRFAYLNEQFDRALGVKTWTGVDKLVEDSARKANADLLIKLPNVHDLQAGHDWVGGCLPGTRTEILEEIFRYLGDTDPNQARIVWLHAMAGMGKSTLAATVAHALENSQQLGGSFFFSRSVAERSDPQLIFATIASQLATKVPRLADIIFAALAEDSGLGKSAPNTQFVKLIANPLLAAKGLAMPIVIILDALDECTVPSAILSIIGAEAQKFPSVFKILITSRPEQGIRHMMEGMGSMVRSIGLSRGDEEVDRDIDMFVSKRMAEVARRYQLDGDWPGQASRKALVQKAGGLFIWVSTALNFIEDEDVDDPEGQLELLLNPGSFLPSHSSPWSDLDALYLQVLAHAFTQKAAERRLSLFRKVVGAIVTMKNPLTAPALGQLLGLGPGGENAVHQVVRKLHSVLVIDSSKPLQINHPSFADFLTNRQRCTDAQFFVDPTLQHRLLACRCLALMGDLLSTNICGVDPSLFNSEVEDLEDRISRYIPEALQYACRFWGDHLSLAGSDPELYGYVQTFFRKNLLAWLEVLSLLGALNHAFPSLDMAESWLMQYDDADEDTLELASDSLRFIKRFHEPISLSATHVYYSALPFSPKKSTLYQTYADDFLSNNIEVVMGTPSEWSTCLAVLERHSAFITCVAFSPDGRQIASGAGDNTIRFWDGISGAPLGDALEGHTDHITSVAFSPDGKRVVSASDDNTLRMWDASTGAQVGNPLDGHTYDITAFKFSPNGKIIISASHDSTLRFWDGETGDPIGDPLRGHTAGITAIAVSPDGQRVVSGSYDNTLRLWEVSTQKPIGVPMRGHPEYITSVAFSPDGARVISGSYDSAASWDNVLCLWDGTTGEPIGQALLGHTSTVTSVAFSSDGAYIASGSADNTVRLWNAQTGAPVGEPLRGHSGAINAIAFSPDGSIIVSGSRDNTLRLWDVESRECLDSPLQGHTDYITAVAFSPDGRRVVSASDDHTLRIWDGTTGASIEDPVRQGHEAPVVSLSFSPDGTRMVTGSWDDTLQLWDGTTGDPIGEPLRGHVSAVTSVAFSADGKLLVSGSRDDTLRLWDGVTGKAIKGAMEGHTSTVTAVAFSSDATRIVSGSWDTTLRLWDVSTGTMTSEPLRGHTAAITSVAFSPDGKVIASGAGDYRIRLWDGFNGAPIGLELCGHATPVMSVTFSHSGRHIISKSFDLEVLYWDTNSRELASRASPKAETSVSAQTLVLDVATGWFMGGITGRKKLWWMPKLNRGIYAYTRDGRKLITGSELGLVTLVDARRIGKILQRGLSGDSAQL